MKQNSSKSSKRKGKAYNPPRRMNPEEFSKRIILLNEKIEKNEKLAEMREHALYEYISLMTNFASHDLKNAIHNLDGYISTLDKNNVSDEDINKINSFIDNLRKTVADFKTLAPDESRNEFSLQDLGRSIELLNRGVFNSNNISSQYVYDKSDHVTIRQSFHNIVQMINNLIINAIKALSQKEVDKKIKIELFVEEGAVNIKISDNGVGIEQNHMDKIFNLHFSTTDGSGIGLYHAKYITESMNGTIQCIGADSNYSTIFIIKFPTHD